MLRVFINFLYFVMLDPFIPFVFRYKSTQLLDRSSFINKININDDPDSTRLDNDRLKNQKRAACRSSRHDPSGSSCSFITNKNDATRNCPGIRHRCNSTSIVKLNNSNESMYKVKPPSPVRHNQKRIHEPTTSEACQDVHIAPIVHSPSRSIKKDIVQVVPAIEQKWTDFLNQKSRLLTRKVRFYSTLYLCDTLVHFLEFYNKFSGSDATDASANANEATRSLNCTKRMEFSNGIAEINQNQNPRNHKNVSKLLRSLEYVKLFWSNLTRHAFPDWRLVFRSDENCLRMANRGAIMCPHQRTSKYFHSDGSKRKKCDRSVSSGSRETVKLKQQNFNKGYYPSHQYDEQQTQKQNEPEFQSRIFGLPTRTLRSVLLIALIATMPHISASFHHNIKYSMNVVRTKYGPLRGIVVRSNPTVEAFLGVPYASPPVGSLRYMPPVTPSTWRNTRLADRFSAVCPQVAPVAPSGPEALLEVPRGRLAQLRRLLPLLANQSEDCLYLNLYVPRAMYPTPPSSAQPLSSASSSSGTTSFVGDFGPTGQGLYASSSSSSGGTNSFHNTPNDAPDDKPLPAILYIHGESYEWNSGNPYDGSVLAAHGNVIVVTVNFRLGVLGFLKTGGKGSAQGNFGLMDLVAGLHWLRENLPAFGGDPNRVTVMGHGTGAALANILIVSPVASDLVHRVILLSGSALSPWAIQKDPLFVKRRVAEHTGCHGDLVVDDLAPCLRTKSISELLAIKIDSPRFLPGFAPFIDGTVIVHPSGGAAGPLTLPTGSAIASTSGIELADFPNRELIFGLSTIESYLDLSAQDLEFGFNETRRDRILRTYVRNVYHYHLNEIYAALKNEYTDWERPVRNPMGSRDASLEFLSDGHTAAPLIRLGYLHSLRGGRSYFLHFRHQSGERDFPQRGGSVRGEDVPFCLGLPISPLFPHNYTKQDVKISRILIRYLTNFALTGNPNENSTASADISRVVHNSKTALVSSSLTVASSTQPRSSPPSMSLVRVTTDGVVKPENYLLHKSRKSQNTSLPALSYPSESGSTFKKSSLPMAPGGAITDGIQKHVPSQQYTSPLSPHQSPSLVTSSVPVSPPAASSPSSVESSQAPSPSLVQSPGTPAEYYREEQSFPSPSSLPSSSSSATSPLSSISHHTIDSKDATMFIAPPAHTVIKSKRHAVAAHRRKRKTVKRLPSLQPKYSSKKASNHRKRLLASNGNSGNNRGDRVNQNYGGKSSSSFLADEGIHDRHTGRAVDPDDDNSTIDDDEDEEETNSDEERPQPDEDNDEDDEDDDNGNNPDSPNKKDDENNNSVDGDENSSGGGGSETFDRFGSGHFNSPARLPFWDTYDAINQLYLELGSKVEVKNHYRGHKLSMWLSLIPQLHSPGDLAELPMRHHHFMEDSAQYYDGIIRPQIMQRPSLPKQPVQQPSGSGSSHRGPSQSGSAATRATTTLNPKTDHPGFNVGVPTTTECPPNTTIVPTIAATRPQNHQQNNNNNNPSGSRGTGSSSGVISDSTGGGGATNKQDNNLFRRLASSQFQSYTTALTVTIAVGCFLLLLNILIFAGIYYQREKRATDAKKKELLREAETLCSSTTNLEKMSAGEGSFPGGGLGKGSRKSSLQSMTGFNSSTSFGEYSCYDEKIQCKEKHALADICSVELPLKEFKCSGSPVQSNTGSLRRQGNQANHPSSSISIYPPSYHHPPQSSQHHKSIHHYPSPDRKGGSNTSDLVTYEQFKKPPMHQHCHQGHSHQAHPSHSHQGTGTGATSSATVGTSTEQCNQSTQSEQPKVQDVATSIDEKAVGGRGASENGSERGSSSGSASGGGSVHATVGTSCSINDSDNMISPGIPEPPPPPKSTVPYQGGILRQPGPPTTPSSNKKRVQIQEISV